MDRLTTVLSHFNPSVLSVTYQTPSTPWHQQGQSISPIYLIHQGQGHVRLNDDKQLHFQTGDLLWLPFGGPHQFESEQPLKVVQIELAFGSIQQNPIFERLPDWIHISTALDQNTELLPLVELMIQEAAQPRCGQNVVLNRLAEVLMVKILRHLMANDLLQQGVMAGLSDIRLARALSTIHDHPEVPWRIEQLANKAGMSRTLFNEQFRIRVGQTPGEYLIHWRMKLANRWLQDTKWSIALIANKLGYESETAFRRAFSREIGKPPGQIRKQKQTTKT